jgi:hypothetical protein
MRNVIKLLQGARLHLSLSKTDASLGYTRHSWQSQATPLLDVPLGSAPDRDPAMLAAAFADVLGNRRYAGLGLSVTVSDEWVRLFMVDPPRNTLRMQDIRTAAAMRFHTLYGDAPNLWRITYDDAVDRRFVACAMPETLFEAIRHFAGSYGLHLASVTPSFVEIWNRVHRRLGQAWFAVVHDESITVGCVEAAPKPALAAVHRLRLPPEYGAGWLAEQTRGIALRQGLHNPRHLQLFGRYVPNLSVSDEETGLVVSWPGQPESARPPLEPHIDLAEIGGVQA